MFGQTFAGAAADDAVVEADAGADAGLVVDDLRHVVGRVGADGAADARDVGGDLEALVGPAGRPGGFLEAVVRVKPCSCTVGNKLGRRSMLRGWERESLGGKGWLGGRVWDAYRRRLL